MHTEKVAATRKGPWNRVRLQLGGGLALAVGFPALVRGMILTNHPKDLIGFETTIVGTLLAVVLGYYVFRRLTRFPGIRLFYHIIPAFGGSFGLVLAGFFFGRFDYIRTLFASSFFLCVVWYYLVFFRLRRQQTLRIGIVPFGDAESLTDIGMVDWYILDAGAIRDVEYDAIVADLRADLPAEWERYLAERSLNGTLVMHYKQLKESITGRVEIEHLSENNFGSLIPGIVYEKIKRLMDVIGAIILVPLLLPLMALIAMAVKLESTGPVIFRQRRMGYRGIPFTMYKFRSMVSDLDAQSNSRASAMTIDADRRITRVGAWIRRYRLDELPQIVNVLRGEMSWIGPRPEAIALSSWYETELPFYRYRHIVRPGITGWAQVKQGHVFEVNDVLSKLYYDFYYIKNFSFWLDLLIVAGTLRTVLSGQGAR